VSRLERLNSILVAAATSNLELTVTPELSACMHEVEQPLTKTYGDNIRWEIKKAEAFLKVTACLAHVNSKDPSTRVGAMLVWDDFSLASGGYNGMPRGVPDTPENWGADKYDLVVHAEKNAIAHCHVDTKGLYLICNLYPCHICAQLIAQTGVTKIFYSASKRPNDTCNNGHVHVGHKPHIADKIFDAAGIIRVRIPGIVQVDGEIKFKSASWDAAANPEGDMKA
jgi:dCMP deaminase